MTAWRNSPENASDVSERLTVIAAEMREGLLETVGVESRLSLGGTRCSMILELAPETDAELVARAIDLENVEAWCDENGRVNVAISPLYSTKDVDQAVLCAIKVIHVLLGLHAVCEVKPKTFMQKILASVIEIMQAQQKVSKRGK